MGTGERIRGWALAGLGMAAMAGAADYLPRSEFHQRLEPCGKVLFGAGQSTAYSKNKGLGGYATLAAALPDGSKPIISSEYIFLKDANIGSQISGYKAIFGQYSWYVIPQFGLSMTTDGSPDQHYEDKVAKGDYDANIESMCQGFQDLGRPVLLRIGYEFNGSWNGYGADTYKQAFIRITQALRKHGLENVATVWCAGGPGTYDNWYPGDQYVDWFGIDLWNGGDFSGAKGFFDAAKAHGKPVIIGETTTRGLDIKQDKTWDDWFVPFFDMIRTQPAVKAFAYINWNWSTTQWADWGNAQIELNPNILSKFAAEIKNPIYLSAGGSDQLDKAIKACATTGIAPARPKARAKAAAPALRRGGEAYGADGRRDRLR